MKDFIRHFLLFIYHKYKNRHLVRFGYSCYISYRCEFEGMNRVFPHSSYFGKMGYGSYIGHKTCLNADIGRFSSIAPNVRVINATHPMKAPFVTTCPLFYSLDTNKNPNHVTFASEQIFEEFRYYDKDRRIDIKIGNDCWIGQGATFIGGVEVCDGAVVLASAWVTKDVPPYAIVGGTPAKIIGYRYSEEDIELLLSIKWWNRDILWIKHNWYLMTDIEKFKLYFKKNDR